MKKQLFLILILIFSANLFAQTPWAWNTPQLLCDSIGDNRNPSFVRLTTFFSSVVEYNVLLWERDFGSHSEIFMKSFADPDSEIAVNPFSAGGFSQEPVGAFNDNNSRLLIVWQSDQPANFDLYSTVYQDSQFHSYQRITTNPGNDLHPDIIGNFLVWERDGTIYYSQYSFQDSVWSTEEPVDSGSCGYPAISMPLDAEGRVYVAYQKTVNDSNQLFLRERDLNQTWLQPVCLMSNGDNRYPSFARGLGINLLWQHQHGNDWDIISLGSPLPFSSFDETKPQGADMDWIIDKNAQTAGTFIGFQSNLTGDEEIYIHDRYWFYDFYNLSQHPGEDQNLIFSEFADMYPIPDFRIRTAWERYYNGNYQIWGSHLDFQVGIENPVADNPGTFKLYQNYPNPFNPSTTIRYTLPKATHVTLKIYNLLGQEVRKLVDKQQLPGKHIITWDGADNHGQQVSSGIYIYQLKAGEYVSNRKMVLFQ